MTRSTMIRGLLVLAASVSPVFADISSLQDILVNIDGAQIENNEAALPGVSLGGWNTTSTCGGPNASPANGLYCGLGSLSFVVTGAPGSNHDVDLFLDYEVSQPFFHELGKASGSTSGQSFEIGDSFTSSLFADVQAGGILSNTNTLASPGDFAAALAFNFTLGATGAELITLDVSHVNPGGPGLVLEGIHPQDQLNPAEVDLFINGSAIGCTPGVDCTVTTAPVPEPASWFLMASLLGLLAFAARRRFSTNW